MKQYFEGRYYKHQKGRDTIAFIAGISADNAFIQVITNNKSYCFVYERCEYKKDTAIRIGKCLFSDEGIDIDITNDGMTIKGHLSYGELTPLKYDIMGVFKYFPMECRHSIRSLYHDLTGYIIINHERIDFTGGIGYIEGDRGKSFPESYTWAQCSDFPEKCCITAAAAQIPLPMIRFTGCICVVYYRGRQYRFATYLGAKILHSSENGLILKQGKYRLEISVDRTDGHGLLAPELGRMQRTIHESAACKGTFRFYHKDLLLFDLKSDNVSFEYAAHNSNAKDIQPFPI